MNDTPETDGEWNRIACYDHPHFENALAEFTRKLERERDKAEERAKDFEEQVNIWKRSHGILVKDLDNWKQLAVAQEKLIAKQLTLLQEHGLSEYGN